MNFSTLSVARTSSSPSDFWGDADRLVVLVSTTDVENVLVAYGVDPVRGEQVFETSVWANQLGSFFKYLIDGDVAVRAGIGARARTTVRTADALGDAGPEVDGIDIPATDPPPPGPNAVVVITYATAVRSDESLAELSESVPS